MMNVDDELMVYPSINKEVKELVLDCKERIMLHRQEHAF